MLMFDESNSALLAELFGISAVVMWLVSEETLSGHAYVALGRLDLDFLRRLHLILRGKPVNH